MHTFFNRRLLASNFLQTVLIILLANFPFHANQRANLLLGTTPTTQIHSRINFKLTSIPTAIDLTMALLDDDTPVNTTPPRDEDTTAFHDTLERRLASTSNSANNSISSELLPTDLETPLVNSSIASASIIIGGVAFDLQPTEQVTTTSIALYTKTMRATYDVDKKGQLDLLKMVQGKQQQLYSAISISVNDPEKLLNHYSLSKLNKECRRNLAKYDLLAPFTIVFPTSPGNRPLLLKQGALVSHLSLIHI